MLKFTAALTLAAAIALPAIGIAANGETATGPIADQISALLVDQGYVVRSIELEDGVYEAEVTKDGARFEITLNDKLAILETEAEDDDHDDD